MGLSPLKDAASKSALSGSLFGGDRPAGGDRPPATEYAAPTPNAAPQTQASQPISSVPMPVLRSGTDPSTSVTSPPPQAPLAPPPTPPNMTTALADTPRVDGPSVDPQRYASMGGGQQGSFQDLIKSSMGGSPMGGQFQEMIKSLMSGGGPMGMGGWSRT